MHVDEPRGAGAFVKIVDVLRDQQQLARPCVVEPRQRAMRGIGLDLCELRPPRIVECVHELRIAGECLGGGDILDPVPFPQAVSPPERRQPAFG